MHGRMSDRKLVHETLEKKVKCELPKKSPLNKFGGYGVQYTDNIVYYLDCNGRIKLCVDNLLNAYPVIVVAVGILLCINVSKERTIISI